MENLLLLLLLLLPATPPLGRQPSSRMSAWSISSAEPLLPGGGGCARYLATQKTKRGVEKPKTKKKGRSFWVCFLFWQIWRGGGGGKEGGSVKHTRLGETKQDWHVVRETNNIMKSKGWGGEIKKRVGMRTRMMHDGKIA